MKHEDSKQFIPDELMRQLLLDEAQEPPVPDERPGAEGDSRPWLQNLPGGHHGIIGGRPGQRGFQPLGHPAPSTRTP
jgi:hypothetical protein